MTSPLKQFLDLAQAPVEKPAVPFAVPQPGAVTHKLTLRRGRAKNFRSIGNEFMEVDYQRNDATLVTSDDNGAGKSTVLVWLPIFVLYNDTYSKKEKKAGLVNSMNKKECVGEIEFFTKGHEWKVRRGIKPDFVEIHQMVDGEWMLLDNEAAKSDTNKYIENILGVDQKMFENSLVLGKEKYIPFTEMYTADRRLMVETIWDLGIFSEMNSTVKESIKTIKSDIDFNENQIQNKDVRVTSAREQLRQVEESNALIQQNSTEQLTVAETRYTALNDVLGESRAAKAVLDEELETLTLRSKEEYDAVVSSSADEVASIITQSERDKEALVETHNQQRQAVLDNKSAAVDRKSVKLDELNVFAKKYSDLTDERGNAQNELSVKLGEIRKGEGFRARFGAEIDIHCQAVKKFHDMGTCPTCTQLVSEETKAGVAKSYQPQIDEAQANIDKVNAALEKMDEAQQELNATIETINADIIPVQNSIAEVKTAIAVIDQEIAGFTRELESVEREKANALSALEAAMKASVESVQRNANDKAKAAVASIEAEIASKRSSQTHLASEISSISAEIVEVGNTITALQAKLAVKPTPTDALEDAINVLDVELAEMRQKAESLNHDLQDHEHLLYFLHDDQTKARIVALYLPFLNSKVNEYLESVNMFLNIYIDDKFDISMSAPERKGQSIFSLSTGQRARLNIAIMMALRDVSNLKASIQCNILVMDEILENLSERGVQEIVMMLRHKFSGNNLFVISQREQEFQEYFEHNIRYGLRSGMTQVINKD